MSDAPERICISPVRRDGYFSGWILTADADPKSTTYTRSDLVPDLESRMPLLMEFLGSTCDETRDAILAILKGEG